MSGRKWIALMVSVLFVTVCLVGCVEDDEGGNKAPTCSLSADVIEGEAPLGVIFTLDAEDDDGEIASWEMEMDDGSDALGGSGPPPETITHTFEEAGEYRVSLTVIDDEREEGSGSVTVTAEDIEMNLPPTSALSTDVKWGDVPIEVTFGLSAFDGDGMISSWELDVDGDGSPEYDGTGGPPSNVTHTYDGQGTNLVVLTVEDDRGDGSVSTAVVVSGKEGHSRDWPASVGTTVTHSELDDYRYGDHVVNLTVLEIIRGEEAWTVIEEANMFNDPPHEGKEYLLALIDFGFEGTSLEDVQYDIGVSYLTAVSSDGVDQATTFVVEPEPMLYGELYPGASLIGWAAFEIPKGDPSPLLAFGRDYDGLGGIWLELNESSDSNGAPFASISLDGRSGQAPLSVSAVIGAMDPDGNLSSWELDVDGDGVAEHRGNGTPEGAIDLSLMGNGSYAIGLTVTDDSGASDTATAFISVYDEEGTGHSRNDPAPVGDSVVLETEDYSMGEYMVNLTVEEVIRGGEAWTAIEEANMFNDEPSEGHEYILVLIGVTFLGSEEPEMRFDISSYSFEVISSAGTSYDIPIVVEPWPQLSVEMYAGASYRGWAALEVEVNDAAPLLSYGTDYLGRGGAWFQLY